MRIVIAGLLGAIVMFVWAVVAHVVLPIGEMGMQLPTGEDAVLSAMHEGLPAEGVYLLPALDPADMHDQAKVDAYVQKSLSSPYAFVVYQPQGRDMMAMGPQLATQFGSELLSAWIVAWALSMMAVGFGGRVLAAAGLGLFSWLTLAVPYWNWYRFPLDFTLGAAIEQVIGWLLAGCAMAWWLGRKAKA